MERPECFEKATKYMQLYAKAIMQEGQSKIKSLEETAKSLHASLEEAIRQRDYFKQMADTMTKRMEELRDYIRA
jgi:phage shock protein A